jgi:hypothetical protein
MGSASGIYNQSAIKTPSGATAYDVDATLGTGKAWRPPMIPFVGQQPLPFARCPIDPSMPVNGQISTDPEGYGVAQPWAACSYACNYLVFGNPKAIELGELNNPDRYDPKSASPRGAPSSCPRFDRSFPDGISNTFLFAEKMAECQWTKCARAPPQPGGNLWAPVVNNAQWAPAFAMESPWHDGTTFQTRPQPSQCNVAYPSTGHYEGLMVGLADCSTRAVSPRISSATFYSLCTPNGSDKIGADWPP